MSIAKQKEPVWVQVTIRLQLRHGSVILHNFNTWKGLVIRVTAGSIESKDTTEFGKASNKLRESSASLGRLKRKCRAVRLQKRPNATIQNTMQAVGCSLQRGGLDEPPSRMPEIQSHYHSMQHTAEMTLTSLAGTGVCRHHMTISWWYWHGKESRCKVIGKDLGQLDGMAEESTKGGARSQNHRN